MICLIEHARFALCDNRPDFHQFQNNHAPCRRRRRRCGTISSGHPAPGHRRRGRPSRVPGLGGVLRRALPAGCRQEGGRHQRPSPGAAAQPHHQRRRPRQRRQHPRRAVPPHMERVTAAEELVERRGGGDQLPHPARRELDLRVPGQGRGGHLLLPPLAGAARRRRRPRPHPRQQPPRHRRPVPAPRRRRVRPPHTGLVQHGREADARAPGRRSRPASARRRPHQRAGTVRGRAHVRGGAHVPAPRLQRRHQDVALLPRPGPQAAAGGGRGRIHAAEALRLARRPPRPVALRPRRGGPAAQSLPHDRQLALRRPGALRRRNRPLRRLQRSDAFRRPAARRPLLAQHLQPLHGAGQVHQDEPDVRRSAAQPAGLLPLRADQRHPHPAPPERRV